MYAKATKVLWNGRIVITINDNPEAATAIPEVRSDVADKFLMFDVGKFTGFKNTAEENQDIVRKELSFFVRHLLKMNFESILTNRRYGLEGFVSEEVRTVANASSYHELFKDNLTNWLEFELHEKEESEWMGTAKMIIEAMRDYKPIFAKGLKPHDVGEMLKSIELDYFKADYHTSKRLGKLGPRKGFWEFQPAINCD